MNARLLLGVVVAVLVAILVSCAIARAQEPRSVWDGVYTEAQAVRGAALFDGQCAVCHGDSGSGGSMAPPLMEAGFSANYDGQTVNDLFERNRTTMPIGNEGGLSRREIADITAFMLKANRFPAGKTELPTEAAALKAIRYIAVNPAR